MGEEVAWTTEQRQINQGCWEGKVTHPGEQQRGMAETLLTCAVPLITAV